MIARFAEFEVDLAAGRVCRNGESLRLERLPLELLMLLVRHSGEILTREQIATELWGGAVHVDEEHGINTAVRKIRAALGDDSANPRFVETVVRRGYRFRAPVELIDPAPVAVARARRWPLAAAILVAATAAIGLPAFRSPALPPQLRWTALTPGIHTASRLASDGQFIYWTETDETSCRPFGVPVAGGPAAPIPVPFHDSIVMDAVPPHRLLLKAMASCQAMDPGGTLWEIDLSSGARRQISNLTGIQDAAWSLDGRRAAFGRGDQLWIAGADGHAARIANLPGAINGLHWSPDGRRLAMGVELLDAARFALWEASDDGASVHPLLPDWKESSTYQGAVFTRGGLVFESQTRSGFDLWRLTESLWPTGSRVRQITSGPMDFRAPQAIPGRGELAVLGTSKQGRLMRFDAQSRTFVPLLAGISAEMPDFSRDGQWVVYTTYPEHQLWRSRPDGSQAARLIRSDLMAGMPRISPDGKAVAFTGGNPGTALRTFIVPIEGGEPRAVASFPDQQVSPTWSPDGKRILYRRDSTASPVPMQTSHLEILDLASGQVTPVRDSTAKFNQRWSPDGAWIAAGPNDERELDLYDVKQDRWSLLAPMSADYPAWSADSRYVYFVNHAQGRAGFYRVERQTRKVELVADLSRIRRVYEDMWGLWAGVTPSGDPLILENADLQQIYLLSIQWSDR